MVRLVLICLVVSPLFSQTEEEKVEPDLCAHPIIEKARNEGLNGLSLKEIPQFWALSILCKRQAKKRGLEVSFKELYNSKRKTNYEEGRTLSGIGSCCVMVSTLILFYSYWGLLMGAD